jgi:RNA polymerase sigma factor (TIGR02999 family)
MTGQTPDPNSRKDPTGQPQAAPGQPLSSNVLFDRVYAELHTLAEHLFRSERPGLTLQPTALVNEAYLRLLADKQEWQNPRHFFGAAAEAMRRILVERARRHSRLRHGGGRRRESLEELDAAQNAGDPDALLALHDALSALHVEDAELAEVVMLRYFAGLTVERTAEVLGRSERAVKYDWAAARAWLIRRMEDVDPSAP